MRESRKLIKLSGGLGNRIRSSHMGKSKAFFIADIWQIHKDRGAGFWFAIDKLQNL